MDIVEKENRIARRRWAGVIIFAVLGVFAGAVAGFLARALEPVKEFSSLPPASGKDAKPLPKVFWLHQYTSKSLGASRDKEAAIKAGAPALLNDREMGIWLNRNFATAEVPKEDLDAVVGAAFVRIGGQRPGTESENVLTVTMPFKLKLFSLPVSDVNLQFVAIPHQLSGETVWEFSDVRVGHARVPGPIADTLIPDVVARYMSTTTSGAAMYKALSAYRSVTIRGGSVSLAAPVALPAKAN